MSGHILLEIATLRELWNEYLRLFGDARTVKLLNGHAPAFFADVQGAFMQGILLGISRLTDPARQGGHANLSLRALVEDERLKGLPQVRTELSTLVDQALDRAGPIRHVRDKWIAHRDRAVALGNAELSDVPEGSISEVLALLAEIHRLYSTLTRDRDVDHDGWTGGGVDALLEALASAPDRETRLLEEEARDLTRWRGEGRDPGEG